MKTTKLLILLIGSLLSTSLWAHPFSRTVPDLQGMTYQQGGREIYCDKGVHFNVRRPTSRYDMMLDDNELFVDQTWIDHFHH